MTTIRRYRTHLLIALTLTTLLLSACGGASVESACKKAADHVIELSSAMLASTIGDSAGEAFEEQMNKQRETIVEACVETGKDDPQTVIDAAECITSKDSILALAECSAEFVGN